MGIGIQICGLNGCGKSTVGRALAKEIGFHFIDNENLYFTRTDVNEPYASPKTRDEVERLLMHEVQEHSNFVFAAVKGDYGKEIIPKYKYVVLIDVPKEIRLQRVRNRSFQKFGNRISVGGDLYEQEKSFLELVKSRPEDYVEKWVQTLNCPIIKVDGTKPALNAVIEDAEQMGVDSYIFVGDYCLNSPFHDECITRIRELKNTYVIRGNEEKYLENLVGKDQSTWLDGQMQISYWVYKSLSTDNLNYLLSLPTHMNFSCHDVVVNMTHV